MSRPDSLVHRDVSADDSTSDATVKVLEAAIKSLVDLRGQLSTLPFDKVVRQMVHARQFVFAGLGASGHVASDASHKFFRLGTPCTALTDTPTIRQFAAIAGSGDVLTGVITALLGQGLSDFDAAVLGVYIHGSAGDIAAERIGQISLTATDISQALADAFMRS